ncbi:MAG: NarK/NasA family nitrate transporter [Bacteriovoracaceae bacterium]
MSTITEWQVEDEKFWTTQGSRVANRNLWISIPALLLGFSTWMMWSIIIVKMQDLGFTMGEADLTKVNALLYTLPAIAGLAGATLRIPNSFLVAIGGGRNVIFFTTCCLIISALGTGIALRDIQTPYYVFAILAVFSGFGGGNFSSSMSNITTFFPKKMQGIALGLNAGLGNLGVSVMQFLLPAIMKVGVFGGLAGAAYSLSDGGSLYIQNAGFVWVPFIIFACIAIWLGMNNLKTVSPGLTTDVQAMMNIGLLTGIGLVASFVGTYMLVSLKLNAFFILPIIVLLTLALMKYLAPSAIKDRLNKQFGILKDKHNWVMTVIYVMTFGSFIGYAASFPKLIQDVFGYLPDGSKNPLAPNPMAWAWLGPFLGATIRPIGGWISDRVNSGSKVTTWSTVIQIVGALAVAYFITQARQAPSPEIYWWPFFFSFMLLFLGSGIGNGSTFRSIPYIFDKEKSGPVLGWTGAIGAYGSFIIPKMFGEQIANKTPEYALYGFTIYYLICLGLNWYYYDRKDSGINC